MTAEVKEKKAAREQNITEHLKLHYDERVAHYGKDKVWATMLYGSQNYGLDTPDSDIDTKTLLIPSPRDVILGTKMVSTDLQISDGGLSNVKDYRAMFQNYLKGNINFVETLFTKYARVNLQLGMWFIRLRRERDLIANCQPRKLVHMAAGMANQKYVAFEKPFESKKEVLEKYGYDPKQLHHLCRLQYFIDDYCTNMSFEVALIPPKDKIEFLYYLKTDPISYEHAVTLKEKTMTEINNMVEWADNHLPEDNGYEKAKKFLDDLSVDIFYASLD